MSDKLRDYAREVLMKEGFAVDLDAAAAREAADVSAKKMTAAAIASADPVIRDLRNLAWSSIDNATTRDVDQIEQTEIVDGGTLIRVAIADVDAYVARGSALDTHAATNTVSVYGGDVLLPMLPEVLSEGLTSLLKDEDRLALVCEVVVDASGATSGGSVYRALVRNTAQLDYVTMNAWLTGEAGLPAAAAGLEDQLTMQHDAAQRLHGQRERVGALEFERRETRPVMRNGEVVDIEMTRRGPARDLIEDFMIAANATIARFLEDHSVSWIRRMVGAPERWPKIVSIAASAGVTLPPEPDRIALGAFLRDAHARDPEGFAALSSSVLRLLGSGSYVVEHRSEELESHFALAVDDYTHFTAPNRRYADVVTQRIVKGVLADGTSPYTDAELEAIAARCTEMEDKAKGVERKVAKRAAVALMSERIGDELDAIVTALSAQGASVLVSSPAVEATAPAAPGAWVGARVRVRVEGVDEETGEVRVAVI